MKLIGINKTYGDNVVFDGFNLELDDRKITAVMGASGSGKTTLLKIIGGLTDYSGSLSSEGKVSFIFQEQRLIPNLTVYRNLEYVTLRDIPDKAERKKIIEDILNRVELSDSMDKFPSELSGGMAQRVALARAFVYNSSLLLMDEPFKGLDVSLKKRITELFYKLYENDKRTVVFVTHDIDDALLLADRIIVLQKGGQIIFDTEITVPQRERRIGDFGDIKNKLYEVL